MEFFESETVELKERYTADLIKEIIAFANTKGGRVYLGVSDSGVIVGVKDADFVMQQIMNALRDSVRPDITMFSQIEPLEKEGKIILKITVAQGTKRPYYLYAKGLKPSGVYVRNEASSAPASEDYIRMMIKTTDGDSFEMNRSVLQELTFDSLSKEFEKRKLEFSDIQMENLGLMTPDKIYTNMGLLVSDQCKHTIKFALFQGSDKAVFKDRKEFGGSLFSQLEDAYRIIDFYNGTRASFKDLVRIDKRDFPEEAVREALLNAIVHRDYSFSASTLISLYSDRLEIISLGGLVPGLSLEAVMIGASQPRNEKLAALFYRLKLIEAYGTGISKIISSYQGTGFKPLFESTQGAFKVVLPNINNDVDAHIIVEKDYESERFLPITKLFEEKEEVTRKDIEKAMEISTTYAVNTVNEMIKKGLIIKVGKGKNTRYRIKGN